jgi:hypothetical protein
MCGGLQRDGVKENKKQISNTTNNDNDGEHTI